MGWNRLEGPVTKHLACILFVLDLLLLFAINTIVIIIMLLLAMLFLDFKLLLLSFNGYFL